MTTQLTQADLAQFTGTNEWHQHWLTVFSYTDGVKYLADQGGAYWLIDAIASYQTRQFLADPMLRDFQIWTLEVNDDNSATLRCFRDTNDEVLGVRQHIGFTDFPLKEVKLYLENRVLMLPSER